MNCLFVFFSQLFAARSSEQFQQIGGQVSHGNRCRHSDENPEKLQLFSNDGQQRRSRPTRQRQQQRQSVWMLRQRPLFQFTHGLGKAAQSGALQKSHHAQGFQH